MPTSSAGGSSAGSEDNYGDAATPAKHRTGLLGKFKKKSTPFKPGRTRSGSKDSEATTTSAKDQKQKKKEKRRLTGQTKPSQQQQQQLGKIHEQESALTHPQAAASLARPTAGASSPLLSPPPPPILSPPQAQDAPPTRQKQQQQQQQQQQKQPPNLTNIEHKSSDATEPEVEVVLSYSGTGSSSSPVGGRRSITPSSGMEHAADNAFLRALRGSSSMDDGNADADDVDNVGSDGRGDGAASPANEADSAFLRALRGDGEGMIVDSPAASAASGGARENSNSRNSGNSPKRSSVIKTSAGGGRSEADNAFLQAFHGGGGGGGGSESESSRAQWPESTEPTENNSKQPNKYQDADNAFLKALQGASSNPSSTLTNIHRHRAPPKPGNGGGGGGFSGADNDFLAAMRGTSAPTVTAPPTPPTPPVRESSGGSLDSPGSRRSSSSMNRRRSSNTPTLPVITSTNDLVGVGEDAIAKEGGNDDDDGPSNDIDSANAAFLGALQASSDPSADTGEDHNQRTTTQSFPDGSFIISPTHQAKMKLQQRGNGRQRVQPPKSRGQSNNTTGDVSVPQSIDSDNDFLLAMRAGSSVSNLTSNTSFQSNIGGGYDSGTLVLNTPIGKAAPGAKGDEESGAFMMAIHSEDGHHTATSSAEGEADESDAKVIEEDDADALDEDIEGLKLPTQPYMEKVLLPRPLFFGYRLPPRVVAEATSLAAATASNATTEEAEQQQPDSLSNADTESSAADDSSVVSGRSLSSVPSLAGATGKRFESSVAPCCRNLEGAIEAFGFGANPFSPKDAENSATWDDGEKYWQENESTALASGGGPHPYVSLYAPVWEEWVKMARAKVRRKLARALDAKAEIEEAEEAAREAERLASMPQPPPPQSKPLSQSMSPATRRRHKKSMSMDFMDSLRSGGSPVGLSPTTAVPARDASFGSSLAGPKPPPAMPLAPVANTSDTVAKSPAATDGKTASNLTSGDNQFLAFARGDVDPGTEDRLKEFARANSTASSTPSSPPQALSPIDLNDMLPESAASKGEAAKISGDDQFLAFARGDVAPASPTSAPATTSADDQFLAFACAGTADAAPASPKMPAVSADDQFLAFARAGTADAAPASPTPTQSISADDQFLAFARAGTADAVPESPKSPTVSADDQFLAFARAGTVDPAPASPAPAPAVSADDQFLAFARAGTTDVAPASPAPAPAASADDKFLAFARAGSTDVTPASPAPAPASSADDQFLKFARAGSADVSGGTFIGKTAAPATAEVSQDDQFLKFARAGNADGAGTFVGKGAPVPAASAKGNVADLSQDQFLQFARGGGGDGTFVGAGGGFGAESNGTFIQAASSNRKPATPAMDSNTFVQAVKSGEADASDEDSIEAAEERTAVGMNDNISAAAAMLAGGGADGLDDADDDNRGIGTMLKAVGGGSKAANLYGRPYSNFELTGGCTPQFSCDDPSLPHESDLGVFETKEEEKRSADRRKERNMIEECAVPGIMPHVACPTNCLDVDDSTWWNSRFAESDAVGGGIGKNGASNTMLISLDGNPTNPDKELANGPGQAARQHQQKSKLYEVSRIAWWNLPDGWDSGPSNSVRSSGSKSKQNSSKSRRASRLKESKAEVFPALDDPIPLDVQTNLWPPVSLLRENNMSGTRSHPATPTARYMPHLSDRPPGVRHIQIDTTAVGFPKLGGEVEPFFCKVAIYHFEMTLSEKMTGGGSSAASKSGGSRHRDTDSVSTSASSHVPTPNMERCGRVTESLNFDVCQDPDVIKYCRRALWPYAKEDDEDEPDLNRILSASAPPGSSAGNPQADAPSEGTSCGMFPLPANLSISNLYAVIIVHKVMVDSVQQLQPYYKPDKSSGRHGNESSQAPQHEEINLPKLRANAARSSDQYGHYTTPFAFGVIPLKHIIGDESPKVPVSRAVQIPLFRYDPDRGPQSIFDHILLMLHPRAEPRGGRAASMTRGHALLVMRYFGYLGLHSVLRKKSSLARERLVDFTGEMQVKEEDTRRRAKEKCPALGETYVLSPWRSQYKVEPAPLGGRTVTPEGLISSKNATKSLYAQEIATLPLERAIPESSSRSSRSSKSSNRSKYDGLLLHTNFCNELICHLKTLDKCPKKNVAIKVEVRELMWNETLNTDVAVPVAPSIHNGRRGPWLVKEAYSSVALGTPQFLDEFKIKLPLTLEASGRRRIGLFFSVYHFCPKANKKNKGNKLLSTITKRSGDDVEEGNLELGHTIQHLGSGFLPLALENSPTCLLANGDHDVPIKFRPVQVANEKDKPTIPSPPSKPKHVKKFSFDGIISKHTRSWSSGSGAPELQLSKSGDSKSEGGELPTQATLYTEETYPEGSLALKHLQAPHTDDGTQEDDRNTDDGSLPSSTGGSSIKGNSSGLRSVSSAGDLKQFFSQNSGDSSKDVPEIDMVLRVTVVAFTSVHPQNKTLADLFLTKPKLPRGLQLSDFAEPFAPWGKFRSEIVYRLKPERIPPFHFVGGALAETERKLLDPVVGLTKSSKCPHSDLTAHLVRIVAQLWRTAVTGAGEPSFLWASPESLIPLRLNAFATLLHTVSSASHQMTKAGLRQLDGNATWDITALGKLLSLLFDEWAILGGPMESPINVESPSSPRKSPKKKPEILSNRSKTTTTNLSSGSSRPLIIERYSSEESLKNSSMKKFDKFDVDAMLSSANNHQPDLSTLEDTSKDEELDSDDANPLTSGQSGFKVDSKSDFMSALTASLDNTDQESSAKMGGTDGPSASPFKSLAHHAGPAANRRRWNTLPLNALATIQESDTEDTRGGDPERENNKGQAGSALKEGETIDTELVLHPSEKKKKSRQMRVPQVKPNNNVEGLSSFLDSVVPAMEKKPEKDEPPPPDNRTIAKDDEEIETAGTAFLDAISKSMGFGQGLPGKEMGGEERRVGAAHHRKTRSRCSIDWTLPPTDMLQEKEQHVEQLNLSRLGNVTPTILPLSPIGSFPDDASSDDDTAGNDSITSSSTPGEEGTGFKNEHPLKRHQHSISIDTSRPAEAVVLPDFADRMSAMKKDGDEKRWWPYVYEIIIYQWVALLDEQTKKGDSKKSEDSKNGDTNITGLSPIVVKYLSHAAKAARGATIRCAPFLLEIIKQSLSWRVDCVFRERKKKRPSLKETSCEDSVPPLVKLDENIMSALEKLITMLTDASIDSRNFDSFEYRKISIDVNDAVVRFIRDLFSILDIKMVHRLVLVYFSRFVTKEGKHWHDRDSKVTGLRCSWETTKLRLNAITLFVRFPGFMDVCAPLMQSWALPTGSSVDETRRFFSDALEKINRLGIIEFTAPDGPLSKEPVIIPRMKPHWLAELCTDICLSATGHAEESIQFRASSLLFELFWRNSQTGRFKGNLSVVASVFVPFLPKILSHIDYLSTVPAKGQLRKDILPCTLFVLQSAPTGILRALWRKLAKRAEGKTLRSDSADKYGGIIGSGSGIGCNAAFSSLPSQINEEFDIDHEADIFDMFGLLNLSLATIEYEGVGNMVEESNGTVTECDEKSIWRREFLLSSHVKVAVNPRSRPSKYFQPSNGVGEVDSAEKLTTSDSRRWHAHDCSMVVINICRQIVREILGMLKPNLASNEDTKDGDMSYAGVSGSRSLSDIFLQPTSSSLDDSESGDISGAQHEEGKAARMRKRLRKRKLEMLTFAVTDTIIFVRAATSVYLHALSMKQSDIVVTRSLTGAVELVKIFGVKLFLAAVGETLQHWMRVILEHCGARRAELRVDACEFLNLLLRLTWESYGSFSRIRLPLLAVQSEVMERIVAKAARKYIMEQRRLGLNPIPLSNDSAEASLTPLWRTIDRLHNQSASRNLPFKSALARLAMKMKRVYRAYLAAHALAIVNRSESGNHGDAVHSQPNPYVQRMRVSVHRIVSNSAWFSKRFLGNQTSVSLDPSMIQTEAVEDSFLIAADVFSSTELPSHRVAWLQKLAEFHRMRGRFAEEATCRCNIYHTYREAAKQHDHIWSSSPFLPWASSTLDGTYPSGEGHAIVSDFDYDIENVSGGSGKQADKGAAFRRIFYRAADSVRVRTGDWGAVSGGKYLFYGVTLKSEFDSPTPWFSHREIEENMVEEAEISGDLYLRAGIVESSRYSWSLANQFYSETFNYARLAYVYRRLALVVTSQVPIIDASNQLDLSSQIGRFYKVYFHGGAPDDLLHSQGSEGFIYRMPNSVQIKDFASRLESAIRCILPNKTTIDLLLDDGSPTMAPKTAGSKRPTVIGGAPIEPVKIKVTPLRPLFKIEDNEKCFRGTPEWFQLKAEEHEYDADAEGSARNSGGATFTSLHQRSQSTSTTNSLSSAGSVTMNSRRSHFRSTHRKSTMSQHNPTHDLDKDRVNGELIGVDRFYFTQPMKKDPVRGFRDWLKVPKGRIAERSLRVTELQVEHSFPACRTRQKILHRAVFTQSPLEASVEAVSTWCSVLFRTVIATNGQGVLGGQRHQGLSADSAKLVMECIHSSGVKRLGVTFLSVNAPSEESNMGSSMYSPYESLDEEEIERVQTKLARMIVTFLELLHLLIGRNRDVLLTVVQARKRRGGDASSVASGSVHGYAATPRAGSIYSSPLKRQNTERDGQSFMYDRSNSEIVGRSIIAENHAGHSHISNVSDRTDSAIGVQSELQRGLISLAKSLSPHLLDTLNNEVPRWMRSCCQDNYFSSGQYRQADIPIGEELFFNVDTSGDDDRGSNGESSYAVPRSISRGSHHGTYRESSPSGSLCSGTSDRRNGRTISSERPPTDGRSSHRRNASGTSYASSKGAF